MHWRLVVSRRWLLAAVAAAAFAAAAASCTGVLATVSYPENVPVGAMRQTRPTITMVGGQLLLNGEPFTIRGVNWNPVPGVPFVVRKQTRPTCIHLEKKALLDLL